MLKFAALGRVVGPWSSLRRRFAPALSARGLRQSGWALRRREGEPKDVEEPPGEDFGYEEGEEDLFDETALEFSPEICAKIRESFTAKAALSVRAQHLAARATREGEHKAAAALRAVGESARLHAEDLCDMLEDYGGMDASTGEQAGGDLEDGLDTILQKEIANTNALYPSLASLATKEDRHELAQFWEEMSGATEKNIALLQEARAGMEVEEYDNADENSRPE